MKQRYNYIFSYRCKHIVNIFLLILFSLLSQLNIIAKYGGKYWDGDGLVMTYYTSEVLRSASVLFGGYGSGVNYQILVVFLSQICHIDISYFYSYVTPIFNSIFIIIIYVVMVELTENKQLALVAAFLLLLQPDFIFLVHRAKHDFYSYLFAFLFFAIFFKYLKNNSFRNRCAYFIIILIFLFSFSMYSLPFFSLFSLSLIVYLLLDILICGYNSKSRVLINFILISLSFVIVINPEIYPPFNGLSNFIGNFFNSIVTLFFEPSTQSEAVYSGFVNDAYSSYFEFIFLYSFNILLGITSVYTLIKFSNEIKYETKLLYVSFGVLTILMLVSDRYGFAGNMGLRAFYFLTYPAVAISSIFVFHIIKSKKFNTKKMVMLLFVISILFYASNVKATADPNWIKIPFHYTSAEEDVLKFAENSGIQSIFADHRLTYVGSICMSFDYWSRDLFKRDDYNYLNPNKDGFYIYSNIYSTQGYRGENGLVEINNSMIKKFESNYKIYNNGYTSGYTSVLAT